MYDDTESCCSCQEEINDEMDHINSVKVKLAEAFTLQRRLPALRKLVSRERNLRNLEKQATIHATHKGFETPRNRARSNSSLLHGNIMSDAEENPLLQETADVEVELETV